MAMLRPALNSTAAHAAPSFDTALRGSRGWQRLGLQLVTAAVAAAEAMSFLDHLDELRRRLIWSVAAIAVAFGVCWFYADQLYAIASAPIRANQAVQLAVFRPQDIFGLYFKVTLVASIFLSAPFVLFQAWLFVSPGLYKHERRYALPVILASSLCFAAGGAFGYFIAFPAGLSFLVEWTLRSHLTPMFDATAYFDLFFTVVVALGIVFQIPVVIFVLSRLGLVTARLLLRHLKHAVFASAVIAAIITPTSDPGNMLLIAGPMIALYGVGILVAALFARPRSQPA